jgi:transcriptional regulator with XRE-family HTH domain
MHELIARGAAAVRRRNGWTQEQAARAYREHGLAAWRTSTVGSLESGLRRPRLDEVILMCAALEVTLADLVRAADKDGTERVDLGDRAVLSTHVLLGLISEGLEDVRGLPRGHPLALMRFPVTGTAAAAGKPTTAEYERLTPLLDPIAAWGARHGLRMNSAARDHALSAPSDAERHAARRLNIEPAQVRLASLALWRRDFDQERDARAGNVAEMEPRSRQARRGLVTREMLAEMEQMLREAGDLSLDDDDPRPGKPPSWRHDTSPAWWPGIDPAPGDDEEA